MPEVKCGFNSVPEGATGAQLLVAYGPTVLVDIGFDPNFKSGQGSPQPGLVDIRTLVDTGAGESCIDSLLAAQLNLPIVDKRNVSGVHGSHQVNMHIAQVHIKYLNSTIYGVFAGVHLSAGGQVHQALIGRSFLQNYTMVYEGNVGAVTIKTP